MPIRLIAGLGNPGPRYADTRHNAGFWFVDHLVRRHGGVFRAESRFEGEVSRVQLGSAGCLLLKPLTFMNRSGGSLQKLAAFYRIPPEEILVVHDDLDLPVGTARLKMGGGHGGHNGLRDIHRHLGAEFARLRIGIGHPGHREAVIGYVLERPTRDEEAAMRESIDAALESADDLIVGDWDKAVRRLHARPAAENGKAS
ncbi:Peptidyl-tRNA hydrolase [Thioalkalivibrio nitratireducens DSM 14787]|uniref:Peptidyl-tRNA hydrolase n=1 Tax=Thioalkalivibrio nitratireducens (strain DSM 14787 / UNIQEM 213 / ALEN2) TaxID=1255043 RepID=L0DZ82_THIND|nr:aminoacyl-tRNA hydrolase [Thioalkalivibrio nitratireducens]AGA34312.1 Peptidyl-tRNA hydrolase [Thioalkalivibrio nitratireducens DSM 14787]